jgi:exodeoxyribonuclease VII large subunit
VILFPMQVMTVSAFIAYLNETFRAIWDSQEVAVEGEVTGFRISQGQWVNFELKDDEALVSVFLPAAKLNVPLQDGMRVRLFGWPRVYPKYGKFSFSAERVELMGEGAWQKALALLRQKFVQEGLFDISRKRTLPRFPRRIALIASRESAAYGDFIRILNERWGGLEIDLYHVMVQGEHAPEQIVRAIEYANEQTEARVDRRGKPSPNPSLIRAGRQEDFQNPSLIRDLFPWDGNIQGWVSDEQSDGSRFYDALVLTRGGGSLQELMAFNDERVVRALFASRVPTLVGIGHERDITFAEEVADVRGSTPTDCARRLVPDKADVLFELAHLEEGIVLGMEAQLTAWRELIDSTVVLADHWLSRVRQRFDDLFLHAEEKSGRWMELLKTRLANGERLLASLNPRAVLERGYALVTDAFGRPCVESRGLAIGQDVHVQFRDGSLGATITSRSSYEEKTS